jgi:surfactin synthase thioesterase subunit
MALMLGSGGLPAGVHPDFLTMLLPVIRRDYSLYETYVLPSSNASSLYSVLAPIISIAAVHDTCLSSFQMLNWQQHTLGGHRHIEMEHGSHFYLIEAGSKEKAIGEIMRICRELAV